MLISLYCMHVYWFKYMLSLVKKYLSGTINSNPYDVINKKKDLVK